MSQDGPLAARYARGLAEYANERGEFAAVRQDLLALRDILDPNWGDVSVPELIEFLRSPVVAREEKISVTDRICEKLGVGPAVSEFLNVLIRHDRVGIAPEILRAYDRIAHEITGEYTIRVETPRPLDEARRARLAAALEKALGAKVNLVYAVTPRLVTGMRLRFGDKRWDNSAHGRLSRLREHLQALAPH